MAIAVARCKSAFALNRPRIPFFYKDRREFPSSSPTEVEAMEGIRNSDRDCPDYSAATG
jgi:hypothetical protein